VKEIHNEIDLVLAVGEGERVGVKFGVEIEVQVPIRERNEGLVIVWVAVVAGVGGYICHCVVCGRKKVWCEWKVWGVFGPIMGWNVK